MTMETVEFTFPDEDAKAEKKPVQVEEELEIDVVDDTPVQDRGRKPAPPPQEVTEDELEQYSESVQKRIKHFTRGFHDERRAKEAAQREKDEAIRLAQTVLEENKRLKSTVNRGQDALVQQATHAVTLEVEQAKRKYKEAYESGDADAIVDAQEALTTAKLRADKITSFKPEPVQDETPVVQIQPQSAPAQTDTKAQAWRESNSWFGSDDEMTAFALGLHQKLVKQGVDPRSDDYYERINARMRSVFPDQFDSEPSEPKAKKAAPVVAPATRSTAPRKIVLTQTQVQLAKRLGVPLEMYARQVAEEMRKTNG